jgi:hypothetical protein
MSRHRIPTASASASTWATVAIRRLAAFSFPAPLIRHGLRGVSSSSTAVSITALRSRYAFAVIVLAPVARSLSARHSRTRGR